jgi:hypothetical protein
MAFFDRRPALRESVGLLLAVTLCACTMWQPAVGSNDALLAAHPDQVRVTLKQGARMVLYAPAVHGDSLVAYRRRGAESSLITLPTRDVKSVEVEQDNPVGVLAAIAMMGGIVFLVGVSLKQGDVGHW